MKGMRWLKIWLCIILLGGLGLALWTLPAQARDRKGWSEPVELASGEAEIHTPILIEDPFGTLHVFWVEHHAEGDRLFTRSRRDGKWSEPLLLEERENISAPQAVVDAWGILHLLYTAEGVILTQRVEAAQSTVSLAWSAPEKIGNGTGNGALAVDAFGILRAAYADPNEGGILLYYSTDGQKWWMQNYPLSEGKAIQNIRMVFFPATSQMILVWEQQEQIFFAAQQSGETWSQPVKINETPGMTPNLLVDEQKIIALWNGTSESGGRFYRVFRATDSWQKTEDFSPAAGKGTTGAPQMGVDVNGVLHVLTTDTGCIWYLNRTAETWQPPFCFDEAQDIHSPSWAFDPQGLKAIYIALNDGIYHLLFSEKTLDVPMKITPLPLPATPTPIPSVTPLPTASPTFSPTPPPVQIQGEVADLPGKTDGGSSALVGASEVLPTEISREPTRPPTLLELVLFGFVPAVVVVLLIMGAILYRKSTL